MTPFEIALLCAVGLISAVGLKIKGREIIAYINHNIEVGRKASAEFERIRREEKERKLAEFHAKIRAIRKEIIDKLDENPLMRSDPAPIRERGVVLQAKEEVVYDCHAAMSREVRNGSSYQSGYSGVSVRVAKGVTVRSGGTRGRSIPVYDSHKDSGFATVTTKRVIFSGNNYDFSIPRTKIINARQSGCRIEFDVQSTRAVPNFILTFENELTAWVFAQYVGDPDANLQFTVMLDEPNIDF